MNIIDELLQATESGTIQWERLGYKELSYCPIGDPDLVISCYKDHCYIAFKQEKQACSCVDIQKLCDVIHAQIIKSQISIEQHVYSLCHPKLT